MQKKRLFEESLVAAIKLRRRLGVERSSPVSPIDLAETLGIEVRLVDIASMEGIYVNSGSPAILLSSLRPLARRNFSCAHELGHHVFGHGQKFDEVKLARDSGVTSDDPDEFLADSFASNLLMPKSAVEKNLSLRSIDPRNASPSQIFRVSSYLGVGYSTFVKHIHYGLRLISAVDMARLEKSSPKTIKADFGLHLDSNESLHVVDKDWSGRCVDCEVGDLIIAPKNVECEGDAISIAGSLPAGALVRVTKQGIARLTASDWALYVRASKRRYVGRAIYRHDEDDDE